MVEKSMLDWKLWEGPLEEIREFRWGRVYELVYYGNYSLLVVEHGEYYGTLYEYSSAAHFQEERWKVLNFGDGMAGAGVPAPDRPNPPTMTDALALPEPLGSE